MKEIPPQHKERNYKNYEEQRSALLRIEVIIIITMLFLIVLFTATGLYFLTR